MKAWYSEESMLTCAAVYFLLIWKCIKHSLCNEVFYTIRWHKANEIKLVYKSVTGNKFGSCGFSETGAESDDDVVFNWERTFLDLLYFAAFYSLQYKTMPKWIT